MAEDIEVQRMDIYDAELKPLIDKIVAVCYKYQIPFIAQFDVPNTTNPEVLASIQLVKKEWDPPKSMREIGKQWCRETYYGELISRRWR